MADEKNEKVSDVYHRIFTNDPLLLEKDNQKEYGKALLRHLLLNRTVASYNPEQVFLHKPDTWPSFGQGETLPTSSPSKALVKRYRTSRRNRDVFQYKKSDLKSGENKLEARRKRDREELEKVTLVSRGEKTKYRRSLYAIHDEAITDLEENRCISRIEKRLRIAAIGYRVQVSKLPNRGFLNEELVGLPRIPDHPIEGLKESVGFRELSRTKANPDTLDDWQKAILAHVRTAQRNGCHFILLPEFSLPADSQNCKMEDELGKLCTTANYSFFLFGGSRHEGGYNRGPIFSRTLPIEADQSVEPFYKLSGPVEKAWWHYKFAPARKLGENTLGRWGSAIPHYKVRFGLNPNARNPQNQEMQNYAVTVAICYDSFDPTMFLNIVMQCRSTMSNSIILVPSFNTSDDFVALLRDLSFLAQATVIYINGLHGDARVFICGVSVSELLAKADTLARTLGTEHKKAKTYCEKIQAGLKVNQFGNDEYQAAHAKPPALRDLHNSLLKLKRDGALKHLITVERDLQTGGGEHGPLYVGSDLIYYNIDTELINALCSFRSKFFSEKEWFLASPLQAKSLTDTAQHVLQVREDRERKRREARTASA